MTKQKYHAIIGDRNRMRNNCSICGEKDIQLGKCLNCGSWPRQRSIANGVIRGLSLDVESLSDANMDKSRYGIGISDWHIIAAFLSYKFSYTNTFYHKFPILDISNPPSETINEFEFLICSDVLEHTMPPLERSLSGIWKMLRPGGVAILSVPEFPDLKGISEKYFGLMDFHIQDGDEDNVIGRFSDGTSKILSNVVFHGGGGSTLETRRFGKGALANRLLELGFSVDEIETFEEGHSDNSRAILARKNKN